MKRRRVLSVALVVLVMVLGLVGLGLAQNQSRPKKLNPYTGNPDAVKEGRALYIQIGCSGCHGAVGGGGMGPALTRDEWKFGSDDETLFKLVKGEIPESTMPKVWSGLENDQIWKILAYIRSVYKGDPSKIDW